MSRISNLKKERIRNIQVERNTSVESSRGVEAVKPVTQVENTIDYMNKNMLFASDQFYDKLKNLKSEYKSFYRNERMLEAAAEKLRKGEDDFTGNMVSLLESYNSALLSLITFDEAYGTNYSVEAVAVVKDYNSELKDIGITIDSKGLMIIDKNGFKQRLNNMEYLVQFLFEPVKGMITRLYRVFRSIKVSCDDTRYKSDLPGREDISGMVLDKKT